MNDLKTNNPQRNTYGYLSLIFGVTSMFFYEVLFFIPQALAVGFGILGIIESKKILGGKKWQSIVGLILGIVYTLMLLSKIIKFS